MGTAVEWEGNIGSAPEFKEFANGNKDPRRLLRLNVYFDNSIPKGDGSGFEDRGGFWANVEWWHQDAERYSKLYQKGMRVMIQGRAVMDSWIKDGDEMSAMKVQASRIAILPHRVSAVTMTPSQNSQASNQSQPPLHAASDYVVEFDEDIPV
ncbi:single-stranded DNA-binding protein [Pseudomonas sp. NPDC088368]|uniref:single-stranded DNA-binding protein n=1 Tax=Pseudomonas sp. NPDC088368 TaxID=3364453 RepID=UPI00381BC6C9